MVHYNKSCYLGESIKKKKDIEALRGKMQKRTEHRYFGYSLKVCYYYNQCPRNTEEKLRGKSNIQRTNG